MGFDPGAHLLRVMPGSVVPNQKERPFAVGGKVSGQPSEKGTSNPTQWSSADKAQQHLVASRHIESIAGDGFAVRVVLGDGFLDQAQWLPLCPTVHLRLRCATPPDFV